MSLKSWGREALLIGAGVALAALVGGLLLDDLIMPFVTRQGMRIRVPDVSGKTAAEAREILARSRLKLQVEDERWSSGVPEGRIIYQRPGPSVGVKEGRTIYVSVSRGDKSCTVPGLTSGISLREARFRIEQAGLTVGRVEEAASEAHPGLVVGQSLDPGSQASRGAAVDLQVSRGPALPFQAPGLVGSNVDSAFALLDSLGLSPGRIEYRQQSGVNTDTVLEQSPQAGTEVRSGDKVDLVVSR